MIKFSKKVEYGLTAILHLDYVKGSGNVSTKELSRAYGIPEEHLGKVLQRMVKAELLHSEKGPRGGYSLERSLGDILLGEVVKALDGGVAASHEGEHALSHQFASCFVKGGLHEIQQFLINYMNSVTLEQAVLHNKELLAGIGGEQV